MRTHFGHREERSRVAILLPERAACGDEIAALCSQ